jgi:hypothetical protein
MSANQLATITRDIERAHTAAAGAVRDAVSHAVRAGELLAQAKASLPHGDFGAFCAALPFAATTARGYMRLAALDPVKRQRVADLPLRAALAELAEPRAAAGAAATAIVIPLGSFGVSMWSGPANEVRWFEVHPVLWPDGRTIGLHYALADVPESGAITCEASRRAVLMTVEKLAQELNASLHRMRVFEGVPVLWAPEVAA